MRWWLALAAAFVMQPAPATQLIDLARQDAGRADKALREEDKELHKDDKEKKDKKDGRHEGTFGVAGERPQQKMERLIEEAHAAAPNKWYQAAKVEDVTPPGDDARKIYKITGMLGTYCVRYADKNRGDQGKANLGEALIGACPHMFKGL